MLQVIDVQAQHRHAERIGFKFGAAKSKVLLVLAQVVISYHLDDKLHCLFSTPGTATRAANLIKVTQTYC